VAEFERAFAALHGVEHAIATTSCTTALAVLLAALGVGPGDEVVVPAFTWVATANVVLHTGATPVLCDVDPATFNIDPDRLAACVGPRTRAVMPVHLFGLAADMDALGRAAPGVPLVCDAACAAGTGLGGPAPAGSLGLAAAFSFHPRKVITTGEGGMVTTSDAALAARVRMLVNHGAGVSEEQRHLGPRPYLLPAFTAPGFNYRMTDLQGAVGAVQAAKLPGLVAGREAMARADHAALADLDWLALPPLVPGHGWQSFVREWRTAPGPARLPWERLQAWAWPPGRHHAVHLLDCYASASALPGDFPGPGCHRTSMAIPLHNRMAPRIRTTWRPACTRWGRPSQSGIAGVVNYDARRSPRCSCAAWPGHGPRGPEGEGCSPTPARARHRRLSILDPPRGQPAFCAPRGATCWLYNGEVYNSSSCVRVAGPGPPVPHPTDTEVDLRLAPVVPRCVERLNGMFAFAVGRRRRTLFPAATATASSRCIGPRSAGRCVRLRVQACWNIPASSAAWTMKACWNISPSKYFYRPDP
jgi:dTDP-4-amino-4,6-dideoxygalactose transaminase